MNPTKLVLWLLAVCLLAAGPASAQERDRVMVKIFPARGGLGTFEVMDVKVERLRITGASAPDSPNDAFYDEIERVLTARGITSNWQYVYPDGAFIRIKIEIGSRRVELASAHTLYERSGRHIATEHGLVSLDGRNLKQILAKESEAFRSRRLAFEEILALVNAKLQENLAP